LPDQRASFDLYVVVDPSYPGELQVLAAEVPVWIISTAVNKEACQRIWDHNAITDHRLPGSITSFDVSDPEDRASSLLSILPALEEHYGVSDDHEYEALLSDRERRYLHLPNGFRISVVGLNLTADLKKSLEGFGLDSFAPTATGFKAECRRQRTT
jgi:hypothetical protein